MQETLEDADCLTFVLIDEVESLTSARKAAISGGEPSDSIRAVNALLTQLDALKRFNNVSACACWPDQGQIWAALAVNAVGAGFWPRGVDRFLGCTAQAEVTSSSVS